LKRSSGAAWLVDESFCAWLWPVGRLLGMARKLGEGAHYTQTLTGFRWIMHVAERCDARLLLGYEQALGHGVTELVRDEDGISTGLVMAAIAALAADPPARLIGRPGTGVDDLERSRHRETTGAGAERPLGRPASPGVVLYAGDAVRLAVRPSGTEPKLKLSLQGVLPVAAGQADAARPRAETELSAPLEQAEKLVAR
jgi:phosphomannomutase